jgi:uncharacterized protein (DUF362 family)
MRRIARRTALRAAALAAGGLALSLLHRAFGLPLASVGADEPELPRKLYLPGLWGSQGPAHTATPSATTSPTSSPTATATIAPLATATPTPTSGPRVLQVHAPAATHWDFTTGWFGDCVDQQVVNQMVDEGLMRLTGAPSVALAWKGLLPAYQPGQKIAVKINLNNARNAVQCVDSDNAIDALIEAVNALIRSLVMAGIREDDVWVYDAIRDMPARFYGRRLYTRARFISKSCGDEVATFNHVDPSLLVAFSQPAMRMQRWLTDLLFRATYVINMPILKRHGTHPVTLGFKNHFGSLSYLGGEGDDNPHYLINPSDARYRPESSPLVDIYANPSIAGKTVLTMADGLFGAPGAPLAPVRWQTFGNMAPNSLFFSRDPVAIDCVLCDFLRAEWPGRVGETAYDYLREARRRGLGTFETGDPWGAGYRIIDYVKMDL